MQNFESLIESISVIPDFRINRTKKHRLTDILAISVYGMICGAEGYEDIEYIAKNRIELLKQYIELENGIPHHDTIRRVFQRLNPKAFADALTSWLLSLEESLNLNSKVVAIDGKTLKHSFDVASAKTALHSLSAFFVEESLVLGQCIMDTKDSEITKIPELLETIDVRGAIITIDAIGCQKNIEKQIVEKNKADYVIGLKKNQPSLYEETKTLIKMHEKTDTSFYKSDVFQTTTKGHGRLETRSCLCIDSSDFIKQTFPEWKHIKTLARITSLVDINGTHRSEERFFISSLPCNAEVIASSVRQHWAIENSLHWVLDVVFREDSSRIRKDHSPANFAILRRFALGLIKKRKPEKLSNKRARLGALLDQGLADTLFTGI